MEIVEALDGSGLTSGGSGGVAARHCDNYEGQLNAGALRSGTDAALGSPSAVFANHSSLISDKDIDDWTQRRPESVWLEYLYSWNPLAAGIVTSHNGYFQASVCEELIFD